MKSLSSSSRQRRDGIGIFVAALAAVMLFSSLPAQAVTYHVTTGGSDAPGTAGTGWDTAFRTISNAVAKAQTSTLNDVLVSNGNYDISATIKITNGIAVRAFDPDRSLTAVNGKAAVRCFQLAHLNALVAGLTISKVTCRRLLK